MRSTVIAIALALVTAPAEAQEAIPAATVAAIKDATVFIRTKIESQMVGPAMSGSGFLIRTEGTTGYIITNAHVIIPPSGRQMFRKRPTTKVYFRSGTKLENQALAEIVARAPDRDLAVLRVTNVPNLPKPIDLIWDSHPIETMTVYMFGFPFGEMLAMGTDNPPVHVGRGQVSSIRWDEDNRIKSVLLDGTLNPGNSGGPVVDTKGKLVGISVAAIQGANIGIAIAVPQLLSMLNGQAQATNLAVKSAKEGMAELEVEVPLLDPLGKVKSARLLYTTSDAKFSRTKRAKAAGAATFNPDDDDAEPLARAIRNMEPESTFGPIEGADTIPLNIQEQSATGVIRLPWAGKDVAIWCQGCCDDGSDKPVYSKPGRFFLGAAKSTHDGEGASNSLTIWGEVVDPDGDCRLKLDDGNLVGEVPGTLHDLNIDIGKNNAPRVVQEVDGDFVAQVKVAGSFQPGEVRTGPKSVPYNGGGLVVWLDQDHYIRIERASMYRDKRVMGFLAFESRELGTRAAVHNKGGLDPKEDLWLRLERRGKVFSGFLSKDGRQWEQLRPMRVEWPARLKLGVDIVNSCGDPMTIRFQDFSLGKAGSGALASGLKALARDEKPWVSYTSTEGNFVIDMPKNPNRTHTRTVGDSKHQLKIVAAQCDTPEVRYIAEMVEFSSANGRKAGDADDFLDFLRDVLAREFNGKVISEGPFRLHDGAPGLDFTIQGRQADRRGLTTIWVREILAQHVMYVLIGATAPAAEPPEDVERFFDSFTIGTTRSAPNS